MVPILLQDGEHGIGLGHEEFKVRFLEICEKHLKEKRAKAFAIVFCDLGQSLTASVLQSRHGFKELNDLSGRELTVFYLHLQAHGEAGESFNAHFLEALGVQGQVPPPCVVCFRVYGNEVDDIDFHEIDERSGDGVLVLEQVKRHLSAYVEEMGKQGDISALPRPKTLLAVFRLLGLGKPLI